MNKIDIAVTPLYVKKMINVLTTQLGNQKAIYVDGRHSDAFVFITNGSCTYHFIEDGYYVTAREGDILYLAHHAVYEMDIHTKKYSSIYCDFDFDFPGERKSKVYTPPNVLEAEQFFHKLRQCSFQHSPSSFAECMAILYRIYGIVLTTAKEHYLGQSLKYKMEEAKEYMEKNFSDSSISVQSLAEKMNMSEVYFRKLFKAQYDVSPGKYMTVLKLKRAKELMQYPFLTLEECARQSGFSSLQYFCRVFKKETGISPGKYKRG